MPPTDDPDVGAEVGDEVDLERGDRAVLGRRQRELLVLVAAVVARHQRLGAGLGVLHRLADVTSGGQGGELLRSRLQLAPEPAAHVWGDDPHLRLRHARRRRDEEPQDVRHLGGGPHHDLLTRGVHHRGARLHEGGDEPLLAVLALDDDALGPGLVDLLVDVATGAALRGVEPPQGRLVGTEVGMRQDLVLDRLLAVQHCRELLVVDVHELSGVTGSSRTARHHDGDDVTGAGDVVDDDRRVGRRLLVGGDRPGVGDCALAVLDVGAGDDRDDAGRLLGSGGVDAGDVRVRERAAHHGGVQHAGQHDVVGPPGPTRDQPLVLLAAASLADLARRRLGALVDGGHDWAPAFVVAAACCTALTMLW